MSAAQKQKRTESFQSRVEAVRDRVLDACREYERLRWLIGRLGARTAEHDVETLRSWLEGPVDWPGQREKAVAALAAHPDDAATEALREAELPETMELLRRVALSYRTG